MLTAERQRSILMQVQPSLNSFTQMLNCYNFFKKGKIAMVYGAEAVKLLTSKNLMGQIKGRSGRAKHVRLPK